MIRQTLFAALTFAASAAQGQTVDPAQPFTIVSTLQNLGYKAQLEADSTGDPRIRSAISGSNYTIWFYGCSNNRDCTALNFVAGFDLTNGTTMGRMNEWNKTKLVGRAYIDTENDPFIEHFIETQGGMSQIAFERNLLRWEVAIDQFKDHIDW